MESTATMQRRGSESSIKRRAYFFNANVPTKKQENFLPMRGKASSIHEILKQIRQKATIASTGVWNNFSMGSDLSV